MGPNLTIYLWNSVVHTTNYQISSTFLECFFQPQRNYNMVYGLWSMAFGNSRVNVYLDFSLHKADS